MQSVISVPFGWTERDRDNLQILCWALDRDSNAHLFRFENFKPFFFIELPPVIGGKRINWDPSLANCLTLQLRRVLREDGPLKGIYKPSKDLYFYQGDNKKPYMLLSFPNLAAAKHCIALLNKKEKKLEFEINGFKLGELHVNVCENDISSTRKMLTIQDSQFSGWVKFKGYHPKMANTKYDNVDDLDSDLTIDAMGNTVYKDVKEEYQHISTLPYEREWIVDYEDICMATEEETKGWLFPQPMVLSFDIEAYTDNHRIFPDMWNDLHITFMNCCTVRRSGDTANTLRFGIVWGNVDDIPADKLENVTVIRVNTQLGINREMAKLVQKYDVDVITGYNILDFDYLFLDAKQQLEMEDWPQYGRLLDEKTELKCFDWSSGGYGFNSINMLKAEGRISIDMYPVIKRDHKLLKYNLNTVAKKFLNRTKNDVEPVEMFVTVERSRESSEEFNDAVKTCFLHNDNYSKFAIEVKTRLLAVNKVIETYIESLKNKPPSGNDDINDPKKGGIINRHGKINWCSNELYETLIDLGTQELEQFHGLEVHHPSWANLTPRIIAAYQVGVYLLTRVLLYCCVDADIALDLFDKLNTWINLIQMSAVVGVSITDVFTRGQQIRCLSQLYDHAAKRGIILNRRESPDIFFNGGFVFTDLVPDLYDGIICVDFNSLYPSIMKQYNICHTTLIPPEHFRYFNDKQHLVHTVSVPRPDKKSKDNISYDFDPKNKRHDEDEDNTGEIVKSVKNALGNVISDEDNYYFRWIKKQFIKAGERLPNGQIAQVDTTLNEGIVPEIVRYLVDERKRVRAVQKNFKYKSVEWNTEEAKQLALKCSANSMFGFMGAGKSGKRSLIEGAMCITSIGRQLIKHVNKYCEEKYNAHVVYGDSVTGDTPILCKTDKNRFSSAEYYRIDSLPETHRWTRESGKEVYYPNNLSVWSDRKYTKIIRVIRHYTNKKIYKIRTSSGSEIKVTEDHSLLYPDESEVSPKDVKVGEKLLFNNLPSFHQYYGEDDEINRAIKYANRMITKGDETIVSIENLGSYDDYVYDLETSNHHFSAGIGRIVVHNTDSSMIDMHIPDKKDYVRIGEALADELSGLFGEELKLEMEKVMKVVFTCPKKYIYYGYDKDGNIKLDKETGKPEITYKGVILARRDYPGEARTTYETLVRLALDDGTLTQGMKYLIASIKNLLSGGVSQEELTIVKTMGASYKDPNYPMKLFGDFMARMGKPIKPGERIGYLVFKPRNDIEASYMGHRMTTPELYEESKYTNNPMEIDYFYYLEKQYKTNIDMLMKAAFRKEFGKYSIMKVRRTHRCNWVSFNEPINFIVQLLLAKNRDISCLDLVTQSMEAIDAGRPWEAILTEKYEASTNEYSEEMHQYIPPSSPIRIEEADAIGILKGLFGNIELSLDKIDRFE